MITLRNIPAVGAILCFLLSMAQAAETKPKYGPGAVPLSQDHQYVRQSAAPDFWALMPYYLPQQDGRSCSVASVAMLVNAARSSRKLTSEEELVTQPKLLEKAGNEAWKKGVGPLGRGVTLELLGELVRDGLKAYGVGVRSVEVVHAENTPAALKRWTRALEENEKSAGDFILINFDQGVLTGDQEAGHIAPIGAYDPKRKQVLILDPDRQWYEPYWASAEAVLRSMATTDKDAAKTRGWVWVKLNP